MKRQVVYSPGLCKEFSGMDKLSIMHFEEGFDSKFSKFSRIYPFATENLAGYLPELNLNGKNVLTVTSSGDQVINSYLLGARDVTSFDANLLSPLYSELKFLAMSKMSFEEFKGFLLKDSKDGNAFDFNVYKQLSKDLSKPAKSFFDNMFMAFGNNGKPLRNSAVFNIAYDTNVSSTSNNIYLHSEEDYMLAKSIIKEKSVPFIYSPLRDLPNKLKGKFDVILLSNIIDYARCEFGDNNYLAKFAKKNLEGLLNYLSPNGVICAAYIYDAHSIEPFRSDVDNSEKRKKGLQVMGTDYKEIKFKSVIEGKQDLVVMLKLNVTGGKNGRKIKTIKGS
jgi:hypothetical protein